MKIIMEVDPPSSNNISPPIGYCSRDLESAGSNGKNSIPAPGTLKRCNSAPMINILVSTASMQISPPSNFSIDSQRTRRFSSSSMTLHGSTTPIKVADRLNMLKQEESHIADRDIQREREVRSAIQISTSWTERFSLGDHEPMIAENSQQRPTTRPRSFSESLYVFTSPSMLVGAMSPTRVGKQCFSPSMQAPIKNHTFTPSPSPSPTRKSFPRSISPIIIRPSPLGKRKLEPDGDNRYESYMSPPKRFHSGPSTPDRLIPHPLAHSVSSSSCEGSSPEQTIPRTSSIHNIPTGNKPQPYMFGFMPLRDSQDMQTTDSETSDVTESTDMSEAGDTSNGMLLTTTDSPNNSVFTPVKANHL
ncbi:P2R1A-PPP2R2A-interacting phosphatase regulator 1-like [Mercenaria mercenaria]|uniref:P2R1A-PPP2R2A-interacting phosphatase regulator 1-like n=1 Tax=Mercenaria mercenaria TaxID=6596 RepID=UPI001E1E1693|nr:P2R1A-PPP2R2A-interacting phosphatase regulator 1-like [Mercenaria mercenaria]